MTERGGSVVFEEYNDILTPAEAAEALRVGMNRIYQILENGELKGFRNGRVWRVPKQAVIEYILTQTKL